MNTIHQCLQTQYVFTSLSWKKSFACSGKKGTEGSRLIVALKGCLHIPSPLRNLASVHSVALSAHYSICSQIKIIASLFLELTDTSTGRQTRVPATRRWSPLHPPSVHFSAECKWQVALIHQGPADLSNKRRRAATWGCCQIQTEAYLRVTPALVPGWTRGPKSLAPVFGSSGCWGVLMNVSEGCVSSLGRMQMRDERQMPLQNCHNEQIYYSWKTHWNIIIYINKCVSRAAAIGQIDSICTTIVVLQIFWIHPDQCSVQITRFSISLLQNWWNDYMCLRCCCAVQQSRGLFIFQP